MPLLIAASSKAAEVCVTRPDGTVGLEFDGEQAEGNERVYALLPGAIKVVAPSD